MSKFTARCIDSADCTAVMHEPDCASLRANLRAPLHRSDDMSEMSSADCVNASMGDPRCWYGETWGCPYHDPATYAGAHVA